MEEYSVLWSVVFLGVGIAVLALFWAGLRFLNKKSTASAEWDFVKNVVVQFVLAAKQLAKIGDIDASGPAKRQWVIDQVTALLAKYKIHIDVNTLIAIIEAVYVQFIAKELDPPPADQVQPQLNLPN